MEDHQKEQTNELNDIKARCDEYLAGWKRAQADYANLKRDVEKEKMEYSKYANERLLESLLPAIDQYETAMNFAPDLSHLPQEDQKRIGNWITGLKAVRNLWENAFKEIGLEKIQTAGAFDPLLHEAVGEEISEKPEQEIVKIVQDGWRLNGRLLRPAKVILSKTSS